MNPFTLQSFTYLKVATMSSLEEATLFPQSFPLDCVVETSEEKTERPGILVVLFKYLRAEGPQH